MHDRAQPSSDLPVFADAESELVALMRARNWSASPLGAPDTWPQSLRLVVDLMLSSRFPMFVAWGPDLSFLYNDAYLEILGAKHPGALGARFHDIWPEVWPEIWPLLEATLAGRSSYHEDLPLVVNRRGFDEQAWFTFSYAPLRDEAGQVAGVHCIVSETTRRVVAERRNTSERERLARMFEQAPGFIAIMKGPQHVFDFVNASYRRLAGERGYIGKPVRELFPELEGQGFFELLDRVYTTGERVVAYGVPIRLKAPGGRPDERFVNFIYEPLMDEAGEVTGIFVEGHDVTETQRAKVQRDAVVQLADRMRDLDDPIEIAMLASEFLGMTLGVSRVGYAAIDDEAETLHVERDWTAPGVETLAGTLRLRDYGSFIDSLKRGEEIAISDVRLDDRTAEASAALEARGARSFMNVPVIERGRLVAVFFINQATVREWSADDLGLIQEVAARTRAALERAASQVALRELNTTLEQRVEARTAERDRLWTLSEDMLARADLQGMMSAVSPAWTRVLGWSEAELLSRPYATFMHPEDMEPTLAALARMGETGQPTRFENRIATKGGGWKPIEWTVASELDGANFIAVGRDLSEAKARDEELRLAQEALRQSQKMEAVGQLTGGLAHDFNNLLAGISGSLEVMGTRIAQGRLADVERYMVAAQGAAKRAAALTHRLLAFSRRQTLQPKVTDLNTLVAGMEDLICRTVGPAVAVDSALADAVWPVEVDPHQLENALLNLCINARDAMPDGGRIVIETGNRWLDDRAARERDLVPGQYVSLRVSDNGTGMTPDVIEKAFDPFFTTKPIGQGTGLGLSMIYGFVRQSGGQTRIYSEVGRGTTVCLYLPRHHAEAAAEEPQPSDAAPSAGSGETVLVIDDEPLVRMLVVDVLEELGYHALEAEDGPSGLRLLRSDARIDLLITDVGLPNGMNGRQVADAARELRPGLPVLFVTGYAENAVLSHGHLEPGMEVVTKPFDMAQLKRRVGEMVVSG